MIESRTQSRTSNNVLCSIRFRIRESLLHIHRPLFFVIRHLLRILSIKIPNYFPATFSGLHCDDWKQWFCEMVIKTIYQKILSSVWSPLSVSRDKMVAVVVHWPEPGWVHKPWLIVFSWFFDITSLLPFGSKSVILNIKSEFINFWLPRKFTRCR